MNNYSITCPVCGALNSNHQINCRNCGAPLPPQKSSKQVKMHNDKRHHPWLGVLVIIILLGIVGFWFNSQRNSYQSEGAFYPWELKLLDHHQHVVKRYYFAYEITKQNGNAFQATLIYLHPNQLNNPGNQLKTLFKRHRHYQLVYNEKQQRLSLTSPTGSIRLNHFVITRRKKTYPIKTPILPTVNTAELRLLK